MEFDKIYHMQFVLGGKIVDTRCTEYTEEPRQNVVKFLGIPIIHMSKQPNILIKVCAFLSKGFSNSLRYVFCLVGSYAWSMFSLQG